MRLLGFFILFLCFNACAASSNGGGFVVGNPMLPENISEETRVGTKERGAECACPKGPEKSACECRREKKPRAKPKSGSAEELVKKPAPRD